MPLTLYKAAVALSIPVDNHESDLYLLLTPESARLCVAYDKTYTVSRSQIDGKLWADIPFAYDPFWEART